MRVRRYLVQKESDAEGLPLLWSEQSEQGLLLYLSEEAEFGELITLPEIDWDQQARFSPYYKDGEIQLPLENKILHLNPGPGFGDLSHPTTQLMLELMKGRVKGESILDVGCGNGVLALASLLMCAKAAHGVDIDLQAIRHAEENRARNDLPATFSLPRPWNPGELVLLNMVLQEQQMAFRALQATPDRMIVSGLLIEQRDYWPTHHGYRVVSEVERDGWWAGELRYTV